MYQLRWPWLCPRCLREHPRPSSASLSPQLPALCPASCLSATPCVLVLLCLGSPLALPPAAFSTQSLLPLPRLMCMYFPNVTSSGNFSWPPVELAFQPLALIFVVVVTAFTMLCH